MAGLTCDNCGAERGPDDVFCENCGFDFLTGTLPEPAASVGEETNGEQEGEPAKSESITESTAAAEVSEAESVPPGGPTLRVSVEVDRAQFDNVVQEGELDFPDPVPAPHELELKGSTFHIGRTSGSRGIYPELDIMELTADEAVSSRHAMIEISSDESVSVTDLGSTNGTTVGEADDGLVMQGRKVALEVGSTVFLGAWTKLTILGLGEQPETASD